MIDIVIMTVFGGKNYNVFSISQNLEIIQIFLIFWDIFRKIMRYQTKNVKIFSSFLIEMQ